MLRVKCDLLGLQLGNQFIDSIQHLPVQDAGRHRTQTPNPSIDLDAFFTHARPSHSRGGTQYRPLLIKTAEHGVCFSFSNQATAVFNLGH
jgi:hypothetical protein